MTSEQVGAPNDAMVLPVAARMVRLREHPDCRGRYLWTLDIAKCPYCRDRHGHRVMIVAETNPPLVPIKAACGQDKYYALYPKGGEE